MNGFTRQTHGDRQALFSGLYNQSFDYVYAYVFARTGGSRQLTEEIVQDAYAAAWRSLSSFRRQSSFRTWVCSIAKNKLRECYRKAACQEKHREPGGSALEELPDGINLEEIVFGRETRRNVLLALDGMRPPYRYVLIMKYMDAIRVKQMAKVLGKSPKAVDGMLQRAKRDFITAYLLLERQGGL